MKLADKISHKLTSYCRSGSYDIVVKNYYHGLWEMDVMKITASGYVIEYEIKISKSDFKNDFKKTMDSWLMNNSQGYDKVKNNKHQQIIEGRRCNRFYFVVPEGIVTPQEVPDHAGLIYYHELKGMWIVKNAKLLHKNTFNNYQDVAVKLSFREENLRIKLNQLNRGLSKKVSLLK